MLEDGIKKKLTARLLALVVIISMISALTGCNEPKEQENGVTLVYAQYNWRNVKPARQLNIIFNIIV